MQCLDLAEDRTDRAIADQPQALAAAPAAEETELAEVTVTGSRIKAAVGMETPTPVTALGAAELETMSATSVTEALVQLPQFYNSSTAENFGGEPKNRRASPGAKPASRVASR